jgi:hypothetical protein
MQRRQFVGSGLALAATWPLRGFTSVLKDAGDVPARTTTGRVASGTPRSTRSRH